MIGQFVLIDRYCLYYPLKKYRGSVGIFVNLPDEISSAWWLVVQGQIAIPINKNCRLSREGHEDGWRWMRK